MAVREFLSADREAFGWEPRVDSWISSWDPGFSHRLGQQGWVGMTIPTEYGGAGLTHIDRYVVTEEVLAAGAPVAAHWVADRQVAPALLTHGSADQRDRYLSRIAAGDCHFAIGMSEPESGSDLASVRTRGVRVDGGWKVSGTKVWTSGAHHSEAFFVLARTDDLDPAHRHAGLSQFLIPLDSAGIDIRPIRLLTGAHHFNEVVLDNVFVPDDMVVGDVGAGWAQVTSELGFERSGPERFLSSHPLTEQAVDAARSAPEDTAVISDIGELAADLMTLRGLSMSIAQTLSAGQAADTAAALVKDLGTTYEQHAVTVCADLIADLATTDQQSWAAPPLTRLEAEGLLHAPGFTLRGGTTEILRGVIAKGLGLR
jgi:alkylation response protein AidB-like acyl-CoA dehydrogenase